jgi:pimeloyl-ACP methyl ester carboxylesterase
MDLFRITGETFFEPDFERPVGAVLDAILPRAEVDPDRVALMGISFGGYFATRAAAHDGRIRALIANSPILDLHRYLVAFLDHDPAELPEDQDFGVGDLAQIPEDIFPAEVKSRSENLMVRFGRRSFRDTFRYLRRFIVGPAISEIQCPALALVGEGEGAEPQRQFDEFVANVPSPVTSYRFSAFEGADTHCQVGNPSYSAAVALDWLDGIFEEMPGD